MSLIPSILTRAGRAIMAAPAQLASANRRAGSALANGAAYVFNAGKEAVVATAVQNYAELFFRLKSVEQTLHRQVFNRVPVNQVNRNELAESLEEFVDLYNPGPEDRAFLTQFCADLRNPSVNFDQAKIDELNRLEKILSPHYGKHNSYISSKFAERNLLEARPGITTATPVKLSNPEILSGIEQQIDLLKSNTINMVLGFVILNMKLGLSTIGDLEFLPPQYQPSAPALPAWEKSLRALGIDYRTVPDLPEVKPTTNLVNFLIEVSNKAKIPGKTPKKIFQMLVYQIIDHSDQNIVIRSQAKIRFNALSPVISSFVGNLMGNLKKTLVDFAELSPTQQLEQITELLIDPFLAHLTAVDFAKLSPADQLKEITKLHIDPFLSHLTVVDFAKLSPADQLKEITEHLIDPIAKLSPTEHLEEITEHLINPFLAHLTAMKKADDQTTLKMRLDTAHQACLKKADNSTYLVKAFFQALAGLLGAAAQILTLFSGQKTAEKQLDSFIDLFLNQFLDPIYQPWTRTAREAALEKADSSTFIVKGIFLSLAGLLWAAGKIMALFQWTLNETFHLLLKNTIVSLCPGLASATKNSLDIDSWYSLKSNLLTMLQQMRFNGLQPRTEDPTYQPPKEIPPAIATKWNAVSNKLLRQLQLISGNSPNITDLRGLSLVENTIIPSTIGVALDMFAQEGFMNGIVLSSLTSANTSGFAPNSVAVTTAEKQKVAKELDEELGILGKNIVQMVQDSQRSDKSAQTAANVFINTLKKEVQTFQQSLQRLTDNPVLFELNSQKLCDDFIKKIQGQREVLFKTIDAPTQALLAPIIDEALQRAKTISNNLTATNRTEELRAVVEAKLNKMYDYLKDPIANQTAIDSTLAELKTLNPSFLDVSVLEADLGKSLTIYKTRLKNHPASARLQPLITLIADHKDRANRNAQIKIKEYKIKHSLLFTNELLKWANQLNFVKVTSKPTAGDAGFVPLYAAAKPIASRSIQAYGKNLFTFIGNEDHLSGIAERMMQACLKKFTKKSSNERRKRAEALKPPMKPSTAKPLHIPDVLRLMDDQWSVVSVID